jgi:hypothetical protein
MTDGCDKLPKVLSKSTVQNAMQRLQLINQPIELTDISNSSEETRPLKINKVVPDSFAEWLAQPSRTITAEPEGLGLENECCVQIVDIKSEESHKN